MYKIKITTWLSNEFEEIVECKDFNESSITKSIESTKNQLKKGLDFNKEGIRIEHNEEIIWVE